MEKIGIDVLLLECAIIIREKKINGTIADGFYNLQERYINKKDRSKDIERNIKFLHDELVRE